MSDNKRAPQSLAEFVERAAANTHFSGFGVETTTHAPCPFCGAAGFASWKILEVESVMTAGATCDECGRGARAIFDRSVAGVAMELVQTVGDEPPAWMHPKPRRDIGGGH